MEDFRSDVEGRLQAIRSAIASVKTDVRGLSQAEAEERSVSALKGNDAFLSMSSVRVIARDLRNPWWARLHPFKAWRQTRRVFAEPDPDSDRYEAEAARLGDKLDAFGGIASTSSRRTMDGVVHVVTINPWSDELARRIREAAAPTTVTVLRYRDAL
jgi:hypothetical protein